MKHKNRIPFPYTDISGYATVVASARKEHRCVECHKSIDKGSTYICIHEAVFDGSTWNSFGICEKCYGHLLSKNIDKLSVDINGSDYVNEKIQAAAEAKVMPASAASRIRQVFQTSDGKLFNHGSAALEHETLLLGKEKLIMYSVDARVSDLDSAIFLYIPDSDALYAFDKICKDSKTYGGRREVPALEKRSYGLYILDSNASQFKYIPNAAACALKSFVMYMTEHQNPK